MKELAVIEGLGLKQVVTANVVEGRSPQTRYLIDNNFASHPKTMTARPLSLRARASL